MIDLDLAVAEVVDEDAGVASGPRRSEGAVKRRGSPSGFVQEKAVTFEASEGGAKEDDKVKHYDADGACALPRLAACCAVVLTRLVVCASSDEGSGICRHRRYCDHGRACYLRSAWVGCLRVLLLCIIIEYPFNITMTVPGLLYIGFAINVRATVL